MSRLCSRQECSRGAIATLTYSYRDSTVAIGPLSMAPEPHSYDLCQLHAESLMAPQGWDVLYLNYETSAPDESDLLGVHKATNRPGVEKEEFTSVRQGKDHLDTSHIDTKTMEKNRKRLRSLGENKNFDVAKPEKKR